MLLIIVVLACFAPAGLMWLGYRVYDLTVRIYGSFRDRKRRAGRRKVRAFSREEMAARRRNKMAPGHPEWLTRYDKTDALLDYDMWIGECWPNYEYLEFLIHREPPENLPGRTD
jgi:hypothetical protein